MMLKYSVSITNQGKADLQETKNYIKDELKNPTSAKALLSKFKSSIFSLEDMPFRHGLVKDERLARQNVRRLVVDNYVVFYVANKKDTTVTIIRILYGRRDWKNLI